jgi:hypothetical protein
MAIIPSEAYTLIGAVIGATITLATTWLAQYSQRHLEQERFKQGRVQLLFKENTEKMYQFASDLGAAAYSFILITWEAEHDSLDKKAADTYFAEIKTIMPRLYADYIILAGLDDDFGKVAASLVDHADRLDLAIGKEAVALNQGNVQKLASLRNEAEQFADAIMKNLADEMKRKRLPP